MTPFDFYPRTRIVFGPGKLAALGELAAELGAKRVLVVSDPGIVAAGHTPRGIEALSASGNRNATVRRRRRKSDHRARGGWLESRPSSSSPI